MTAISRAVFVVDVLDEGRDDVHGRRPGRPPAPLAGDELVVAVGLPGAPG